MFALVILSFLVVSAGLRARMTAVKNNEMDFRYFKTFSYGTPTEMVLKTSRNFTNLFEVPVLFYVACLVAMIQNPGEDQVFLYLAWGFVASRYIHSLIHIGTNKIYPRLASYSAGWLILLGMWGRLLFLVHTPQ